MGDKKGLLITDLGVFDFYYKDSLQMERTNSGMSWKDFYFFSNKIIFSFKNLKNIHKFVIFVFNKNSYLFDSKFFLTTIDMNLVEENVFKYSYCISFQQPQIFDLDSIPDEVKKFSKSNEYFKKVLVKKRLSNENN